MRYLTDSGMSQFDLEEAVAWEQLGGLGADGKPQEFDYDGFPGRPTPPPAKPPTKPPAKPKPGGTFVDPLRQPKPAPKPVSAPGTEVGYGSKPYQLPVASGITKAPTPSTLPPSNCGNLLQQRCFLYEQYAMRAEEAARVRKSGSAPGAIAAANKAVADVAHQIALLSAQMSGCNRAQVAGGQAACPGVVRSPLAEVVSIPPAAVVVQIPPLPISRPAPAPAAPPVLVRLPPVVPQTFDAPASTAVSTPSTETRITAMKQAKADLEARIAADYRGGGSASRQDEEQVRQLSANIKKIEALKTVGGHAAVRDIDKLWRKAVDGGYVKMVQGLDDVSFMSERTDAAVRVELSSGERGFVEEFQGLIGEKARKDFLDKVYAGVSIGDGVSAKASKIASNLFGMSKKSEKDKKFEKTLKDKGESAVDPEELLMYRVKKQMLDNYGPVLEQLGKSAYSYAASVGGRPDTRYENYKDMEETIGKMGNLAAKGSVQAIKERLLNPVFKRQALDYAINTKLTEQLRELEAAGAPGLSVASLEKGVQAEAPNTNENARLVGDLIASQMTDKISKINYANKDKVVSAIVDTFYDIYKGGGGSSVAQDMSKHLSGHIARVGGRFIGGSLQKAYAAASVGDLRQAKLQMDLIGRALAASAKSAVYDKYATSREFVKTADSVAGLYRTARVGQSMFDYVKSKIQAGQPAVVGERPRQ